MDTHPPPTSGQTTASRLMWFFAFVYVAEGLAQVSGILKQPLNNYLLNGLHWDTASVTAYMLILGLPWTIKPIYGLVSDCLPLFGYRRRSYLFLFAFAATGALLALTRLNDPGAIKVALFIVVTSMAATSALCGALLVEHGKHSGMASKFCSQQTLWVNIANIAAALSGAWLCSNFAPRGALHWGATIALFAPLLIACTVIRLVDEEKTTANCAQFKLGLVSIYQTIKTKSTWGIAVFLMLWAFNPGFGAPLYSHMQGPLGFSQGLIGTLNVIYAAGAALGGLLYMKVLSPRYSIKTLAAALIISGALVQTLFVFMVDKEIAMSLHFVYGLATSMALLNAHVIATNRCPDHAEGFMYGILLAAANLSFSTSQALGGYLYDKVFNQAINPLILISAALTFSCIFLLRYFDFDKKSMTAQSKGSDIIPPSNTSVNTETQETLMLKAKSDLIPKTAEEGINIDLITGSKQFQDWVASVDDTRFIIELVHFQSVDMFTETKIGFIKFKATITDTKGKKVPGIVFMTGGSVGMLIVINKKWVVMTVQPRVATGSFEFVEIPAGMLDGSGNFAGVAAKEIEEELGLKISSDELTDLGAVAGLKRGFFVSPGRTEETIRLFTKEIEVSDEELAAMNGKCTGLITESEQITLKIVPLEDLWKSEDGKTAIAYLYYQKLLASKA